MEKRLVAAGCNCQAIYNKSSGIPIIFLHGLSYTIEIWQEINLIAALLEKQLPFLALDMPYGFKSQCQPKTRDIQTNVDFAFKVFTKVFGQTTPLVVGASLGGYIALKYAERFPVKGLLVVAPANSLDDKELVKSYNRFDFPVRVVWGSFDSLISGEEMRTLTDRLPNSKMLVYEGAAHSAYQDRPLWFIHDLLELYASIE